MIIFHEGLPGSGKSYEAVVNRIIPALLEKRKVFAYIEGLNFDKFSEITGIPVDYLKGRVVYRSVLVDEYSALPDEVKKRVVKGSDGWTIKEYEGLLFQIEKEQVKTIYQHIANDSLVLIDELQDFFPAGQRKLDDNITSFVTQHRHLGVDVVVMGQDHRDCHNLWKRRIDQLYQFVKRDAIGQAGAYTWRSYKLNEGKLSKLRSGKGVYDQKYFGLYASHATGTSNTENYKDDRSNVLKSWGLRFGVPLTLLGLVGASWWLYRYFHTTPDVVPVSSVSAPVSVSPSIAPVAPVSVAPAPLVIPKEKTLSGFTDSLIVKSRPRLAGLIRGKDKATGLVQFFGEGGVLLEALTLNQLRELGWNYRLSSFGLYLVRGKDIVVVTAWPIPRSNSVAPLSGDKFQGGAIASLPGIGKL